MANVGHCSEQAAFLHFLFQVPDAETGSTNAEDRLIRSNSSVAEPWPPSWSTSPASAPAPGLFRYGILNGTRPARFWWLKCHVPRWSSSQNA
jgi:hypothetical protein